MPSRIRFLLAVAFFWLLFAAPNAWPQSAGEACDTLLAPQNGETRSNETVIAQCVADLSAMPERKQDDFAERYLKFGYGFIDAAAQETLAGGVSRTAARRLQAGRVWQDARNNTDGVADTILRLKREALASNDTLSIASLKLAQAALAQQEGDSDAAKAYAEEGIILADTFAMAGLKSGLMRQMAVAADSALDREHALDLFREAFYGYIEIGDRYRAGQVCEDISIMTTYLPDASAQGLAPAIAKASEEKDPILPCLYLAASDLSPMRGDDDDGQKWRSHAADAMRQSQEFGFSTMRMRIRIHLGDRAAASHEYGEALEEYLKAVALYESDNNYAPIPALYNKIGAVFFSLGDGEKALEHYQYGVDLLVEYDPSHGGTLSSLYTNIGAVHAGEGRYEKALEYYDLAQAQAVKAPDMRREAFLNHKHAEALHELGRTERAIAMARQSVGQYEMVKSLTGSGAVLTWLAMRYLEQGDMAAAEGALTQTNAILDSENEGAEGLLSASGDERWKMDYAQSMSRLLHALGRADEAMEYSEVALTLSEKRFEADKLEAVANADILFKLRARNRDLDLMRDEALVADLELRQSRNRTMIGFLTACMAGLTALLLFRSYRYQRKLASAKDTLLSEIHHRTKNNLQLLSSLLTLDARRSAAVTGGMNAGRDAANRARTMALVHNHIFDHDKEGATKVDIKEFLEDLIALLRESYDREGVRLEGDIVSAMVDVDRLTPLGLIVCELVSNAYKHAFDETGGTITVCLSGEPGTLELTVRDDGVGFDVGEAKDKKGSLGLTLLDDLSKQIDGKIDVISGPEGTISILSKVGTTIDHHFTS